MNCADVVGYTYEGSFYCSEECLPEGIHEKDDEVGAVFADSEWDAYPVCDTCREQCKDVSLTEDGLSFEAMADEETDEDDLVPEPEPEQR